MKADNKKLENSNCGNEKVEMKAKEYSLKKILEDPVQVFFMLITVVNISCLIPFTYYGTIFISLAK